MPSSDKQRKEREQTNRLHSMLVHEVSIVDQPANLRRFLVVKRNEDMSAAELLDDGRGGLVASDKAEETDDDKKKKEDLEAAEAAEAEKAAPPFGGGPPGGAPAGDDKDDDEEEDDDKKKPPPFGGDKSAEAKKAIGDAAAQLHSVVEAFKTAGLEVDEETQAKLDNATKALAAFAPADKSAAAPELPGGADAVDTLKSVGADSATIDAINRLLGKRGGHSIEKAGARMAKERLERFRKAMELLQSLLKEFIPADLGKSASGNAGASLLSMIDPSFVSGLQKNAKQNPELVSKLDQLVGLIETQNSRIDTISKSTGSNVIPLETKPQTVDKVHWPIDVNRPITRETVDKSVSFFDVE